VISKFGVLCTNSLHNYCVCEVLEETVRNLEGHLESKETEKLAAYERETQLNSKVTKYNISTSSAASTTLLSAFYCYYYNVIIIITVVEIVV